MNKTLKKVLLSVGCVFLALLLIVVGYLGYVILSYSRIDDNLTLTVNNNGANQKVATGTQYNIVSNNLGFGAYTADYTFFMDGGTQSWAASEESAKSCIAQACTTALAKNPDFVVYQEVDFDSTRTYHMDQTKQIYDAFGAQYGNVFAQNYHSAFLMSPLLQPHGSSNSGIITMSKFEASSALRRQLPISTGFSKFLDLDRCYSVTRYPMQNGKEFVLFNAHLSAYGGSDSIHAAQLSMILADMQAEYEKGNYCVCGGDFNDDFTGTSVVALNGAPSDMGWAQPFPVELFDTYTGISRAINYDGGEILPSCRNCDVPYVEGNFTIIVDGFLVSQNVKVNHVENVQTGFAYSDHNPVFMQFELV